MLFASGAGEVAARTPVVNRDSRRASVRPSGSAPDRRRPVQANLVVKMRVPSTVRTSRLAMTRLPSPTSPTSTRDGRQMCIAGRDAVCRGSISIMFHKPPQTLRAVTVPSAVAATRVPSVRESPFPVQRRAAEKWIQPISEAAGDIAAGAGRREEVFCCLTGSARAQKSSVETDQGPIE